MNNRSVSQYTYLGFEMTSATDTVRMTAYKPSEVSCRARRYVMRQAVGIDSVDKKRLLFIDVCLPAAGQTAQTSRRT